MKKLFVMLIALVFSYAFFGCSSGKEIEKKESVETVQTTVSETVKTIDYKPPDIVADVKLHCLDNKNSINPNSDVTLYGNYITKNKDTIDVIISSNKPVASIKIRSGTIKAVETTKTTNTESKKEDKNSYQQNKESPLFTIQRILVIGGVLILFVTGIYFFIKYKEKKDVW